MSVVVVVVEVVVVVPQVDHWSPASFELLFYCKSPKLVSSCVQEEQVRIQDPIETKVVNPVEKYGNIEKKRAQMVVVVVAAAAVVVMMIAVAFVVVAVGLELKMWYCPRIQPCASLSNLLVRSLVTRQKWMDQHG